MKPRLARSLLMAFTVTAVALGVAQTARGAEGRGKGTLNPGHCKPCFPAPASCSLFECENHFCHYTCTAADGSTYPLSTPRQP